MATVDTFVDEELAFEQELQAEHATHTNRVRNCPLCARDCNHMEVERDDDGIDRFFYRCVACAAVVTPVNDPEGPYWVSLDD